jgi:hypothetical protein
MLPSRDGLAAGRLKNLASGILAERWNFIFPLHNLHADGHLVPTEWKQLRGDGADSCAQMRARAPK